MDNNGEIDRFFAGLLRGEDASWPSRWRGSQIFDEIIGRVIFHGVAGLVLRRTPDIANWPSYVVNGIRSEALSQTMWELRHHSVLGSLIENLAHCGIASVVMKGTALAYARYDEPALRRRSDTDLLVQKADLRATRLVLKDLGFRNSEHTRTIFGNMYYQESWHLAHVDGTNHEIDLHWEVTNSRALSAVLNAAECLSKAVPLPRLSKSARSTDSVTQLIQCSLNRAIHGKTGYYSNSKRLTDKNRLIWAVDFDLIVRALTDVEWSNFLKISCDRGVASICLDSLVFARDSLETKIPIEVEKALKRAPSASPITRYVDQLGGLTTTLADLRATTGVMAKMSLILARTFPSANFLREEYPAHAHRSVWILQVRRLCSVVSRAIGAS